MGELESGFGARFTAACREAGLPASQNALGKALGVSGATINYYRNGIKLPSMKTAIRIAEKTGVCVEWLLTGRGKKTPAGDSKDNRDVLDLEGLPPDTRKLIQNLLAALAKKETTPPNHDA